MSDTVFYILVALLAIGGLAFIAVCAIAGNVVPELYPILVLIGTQVLSRRLVGHQKLASSILFFLAAVRGVMAGWILYLTSFVVRDLHVARSYRHVFLVLGSLAMMFAVTAAMRACVVSQNAAIPWEAQVDEPVVLLLRNFSTDGLFDDDADFFTGVQGLSEEEKIGELMARAHLGRFVALARPDGKTHELGAERLTIGSQNWKEVVSNLISRANAVVMRLGTSESMLWELDAVVQAGKEKHTLFMLPAATSDEDLWQKYDAIRDRVANCPGYPAFPTTPPSRARFMYFEDRGAEFLRDPEKGKANLSRLLTPFFNKLGVRLAPRKIGAELLFGRVVAVFVGCYLFAIWILGQ